MREHGVLTQIFSGDEREKARGSAKRGADPQR